MVASVVPSFFFSLFIACVVRLVTSLTMVPERHHCSRVFSGDFFESANMTRRLRMPMSIICTSCQTSLRVPESSQGRKITCPKCGARNTALEEAEEFDERATVEGEEEDL